MRLLLAGLSGLLCYLAFPPADLGVLAWVSLVPLFFALGFSPRPWQGALLGLIYGTVFFALLLQYIAMFGCLPWLALAVFQGLFFALFGWAAAYLRRVPSPLVAVAGGAAAWVLVEYLRSHAGPLAFSLGNLAYSQHTALPIIQIVGLLGGDGVTFLIVLSNATLAQVMMQLRTPQAQLDAGPQRATVRCVVAASGLIGLAYIGGMAALLTGGSRPPAGPAVRIGLVQGNVDLHTPVTGDDAERCRTVYSQLSQRLPDNLDLVVWPETALPVVLNEAPAHLHTVAQVVERLQAHLLTGALERSAGGELHNTAYLFGPAGEMLAAYHKIDLVIFGEYVPAWARSQLASRYPVRRFDFVPGNKREPLRVKGTSVGVLICFEAIFSAPARELCRQGVELLVFITSDVWAAGTPEVLQHSYTAPLRAVEARKYVVRAATMGRSALISPYGEVLWEIPVATAGATAGEIYRRPGLSVYHRFGDLPLLAICALLWTMAMLRRQSPGAAQ